MRIYIENYGRIVGVLLCVVLLAVIGLLCINVYYIAYPPDRLKVDILHFPADAVFKCMVVEDDDGFVSCLHWSTPGIVPPPTARHPSDCVWSDVQRTEKETGFHNYVQWKPGRRYGVVTLTTDNRWFVYWFDPNPDRVFDLETVKPEPVPPYVLRNLGLSRVRATKDGWDNDGPQPAGDER